MDRLEVIRGKSIREKQGHEQGQEPKNYHKYKMRIRRIK